MNLVDAATIEIACGVLMGWCGLDAESARRTLTAFAHLGQATVVRAAEDIIAASARA